MARLPTVNPSPPSATPISRFSASASWLTFSRKTTRAKDGKMIWQTKAEATSAEVEALAERMLPGWLLAQRDDGFGLPLLSGLFFSTAQSDEAEQPLALESEHIF